MIIYSPRKRYATRYSRSKGKEYDLSTISSLALPAQVFITAVDDDSAVTLKLDHEELVRLRDYLNEHFPV